MDGSRLDEACDYDATLPEPATAAERDVWARSSAAHRAVGPRLVRGRAVELALQLASRPEEAATAPRVAVLLPASAALGPAMPGGTEEAHIPPQRCVWMVTVHATIPMRTFTGMSTADRYQVFFDAASGVELSRAIWRSDSPAAETVRDPLVATQRHTEVA